MSIIIELLKNIAFYGGASALVAILVNPLQFLKIIRQETGEKYGEIAKRNYEKGGIRIFYRGLRAYVEIQFLVNVAFAFSEFFSIKWLSVYQYELTAVGIIVRAFSASILETLMTIKSEVSQIAKNKGELMKKDGEVSSIITSIFVRNTINWFGSLWSIYFIHKLSLGDFGGFVFSFVVGIIFAILTLPFDIVATHNCGSLEKLSILQRLKKIAFESGGYSAMYRGSIMRIIMMTCYSVSIVLVSVYLMK